MSFDSFSREAYENKLIEYVAIWSFFIWESMYELYITMSKLVNRHTLDCLSLDKRSTKWSQKEKASVRI